ncbi:MAG: carboxylating nicotinate-nucleotide diphosphorylase [Opitutales bacterium]|nr:carboxylating nicotinate-nucleotide diphosphorylase [Opitutales bacterium]
MKSQKYISHLVRKISWEELDQKYLRALIENARAEDIEGAGLAAVPTIAADITTMSLTPKIQTSARLVARRDMSVCGMKLIPIIMDVYSSYAEDENLEFFPLVEDGERVRKGTVLGEFKGSARIMLQAERIMLNFLQRLSGVATETSKYADLLKDSSTKLLDTRKTTPGLRVLEKYAFACGGGYNHRIGLFDRVMLKDNHLFAAQAVNGEMLANAVRTAKVKNCNVAVEVEVDSIEQIQPVLDAEADVIMLDNFSYEDMRKALEIIGDKAWVEVSGQVTIETLPEIAKIAPDFVSSAAPVHSSKWIDIGLDS